MGKISDEELVQVCLTSQLALDLQETRAERDKYKFALEVVANDEWVSPSIEVAVAALGISEAPKCFGCSNIIQSFLCFKCRSE